MAELKVRGFKLGITDDIGSQNPQEAVELDNFDIDFPSGDIVSRGGSIVHNDETPRITSERVSNLITAFDDSKLLAISEAKIFEDQGEDGIVEIRGPTNNQAFPNSSADMIACSAERDNETIIVCDDDEADGAKPIKVYEDEDGVTKIVSAGLPKMDYNFPIQIVTVAFLSLANDIRLQFLEHYADATRHPTAADAVSPTLITSGPLVLGDDLDTIVALVKQLMAAYKSHYADLVKPVPTRSYHSRLLGAGPAPVVPLYDESDPITWRDCALRLNDLKRRHNWHMRSYQGHPSTGPDIVTAASIPGCNDPYESSTFFTDISYSDLTSVAILLYGKFLLHRTDQTTLGIAHSLNVLYNITGLSDTVHAPTIATATDYESLVELVTQLYAAIRDHVADATVKGFTLSGTSTAGSPQLTAITTVAGQGSFSDVADGMYAGDFAAANQYPQLTTVVPGSKTDAGGAGDPQLQLTKNASNTLTREITFTRSLYHVKDHAAATNIPQAQIDLMTPSESITVAQAANNLSSLREMLVDLVAKYNYHDGPTAVAGQTHANSGLQQVQIPETIPATPQEVRQYIYAAVFRRNYKTSDGKTRTDISTPFLKIKFCLRTIEDSPSVITMGQLLGLSNGATDNYDTANTIVEFYRTKDVGSVLRFAGSAKLTDSTFIDNTSDAELDAREALYTTGGVVGNDPPPLAKCIWEHNGFAYYGNLKVGDEYLPNTIAQSINEDLDSVPENFTLNLPGPVVGGSSTPRDPIAWTKTGTYRIDGSIDERGQGAMIAVPISEEVGLYGGLSPVRVDQGVVFAGTDGFYMTDGYKLIPLAGRFQETYSQLVQTAARARRIQGVYDSKNQTVIWACAFDGDENDICFVLHLAFGVGPQGGSFTTWSGGGSFRPTALALFEGNLIRGDSRGYILRHNQDNSDPFIDPSVDPADWTTQAIVFDYTSCAFEFGVREIKKWVTKIVTKLFNVGKTTIRILRINDHGKSTKELEKIEFSGVPVGARIEKRFFPAGNLRCETMQVRMTNETVGQPDEKTRISSYTVKYEVLGDSFSDRGDDAEEIASA